MQTTEVSGLTLPYLAVDEAGFSDDPVAHFRAARSKHDWLAQASFGYVITEHRAMRELLAHDAKMQMGFVDIVDLMGATGTPWGDFIAGTVQVQSAETHRRLRNVLAPHFTPRLANRYRETMREVIAAHLDQWAPRGAFDFEEFASYFPITVMCRIIGASPDVIPGLRSSLEALGLALSMDRRYLPQLQESVRILDAFVRQLVADRRGGHRLRPEPDLLDRLLAACDEGGLSEEELYNLLIFLFGAGYDTSKNVLTLIMHILLDRPDDYAHCGEDMTFCRQIIEESLRYRNPSSATRVVNEDIEFRGVVFPARTLIMFPWSMSGRDPTAVDDPDLFNPWRGSASRHHMAFGMGAHICLGQFIARAQIEEGLHMIAQRIGRPRLAGEVAWRPFPGVWGIRGLPIEFDDVNGATGQARPGGESEMLAARRQVRGPDGTGK